MKCQCGCNGDPQIGDFLPGHDQKLRTDMEARVGGLLAMRDLIAAVENYAAGTASTEDLGSVARRLFFKRRL